jgi:hypothetical protein
LDFVKILAFEDFPRSKVKLEDIVKLFPSLVPLIEKYKAIQDNMANLNSNTPEKTLNPEQSGQLLAASIERLTTVKKEDSGSNESALSNGTGPTETEAMGGEPSGIPSVPTSGRSETGFTTIVNVSASEEFLRDRRNVADEDEEVFVKGDEHDSSAFKDHSYTLRETLSAKGRPLRRSKACGECDGCIRPNCNKCRFCLDKPKNGGPNRLKKRCIHRVCTKMVPSSTYGGQRKSAILSASSGGEEDEYEEMNDTDNPNSSQDDDRQMDTDKHTAIVTVDDTASSPIRPRRAKIMPKKFQADYAVAYNVGKRNSKYLSPSSNIMSRSLKKAKSDVTIRQLRRRHGLRQGEPSIIDDLPDSAPGTTLTSKRRFSESTPKSIHIRRSTPGEDTPVSGKLSPVPQPVLSSWVNQSPGTTGGSVIVVARTKDNSCVMSAATGLSLLANGASGQQKLPHSPIVAKLQTLGVY